MAKILDLWPKVKLKVYQISANLVRRELRNATFEGEKMPTSITLPDSGDYISGILVLSGLLGLLWIEKAVHKCYREDEGGDKFLSESGGANKGTFHI